MNKRFFLLVFAATLSACSKSSPQIDGQSEQVDILDYNLDGTNAHNLDQIYLSSDVEDCDISQRARRYEVGQAIDSRAAEIDQFYKREQIPKNAGVIDKPFYEVIPFGPTYFLRLVGQLKPPEDKITSAYIGWPDIFTDYEKIKNTAVDSNWASLERYVKGVLLNDYDRIVFKREFALDQNSSRMLKKAADQIKSCGSTCETVNFDRNFLELVSSTRYLRASYVEYLKAKSREEKRILLKSFSEILAADLNHLEFFPNATVKYKAGTYTLPLDPGVFDPVKDQLANIIEVMWKSSDTRIKIEWQKSTQQNQIFRIDFVDNPGQVASTYRADRIIVFYPGTKLTTIAHEIGHALGFPDHYYYLWNSKTCYYKSLQNYADIMSDSTQGRVLPSHWAKLKEVYQTRNIGAAVKTK